MWFSSISALWRSKPRLPRPASRRPAPHRPSVEALEDRSVPSALGADGLLDVSPHHGAAALVRGNGGASSQHSTPSRASADGQLILQIDPTPDNPVGVQVYS